MADLSDRFNEGSRDDIQTVIRRGLSLADPHKREIFSTLLHDLAQDLEEARRTDERYRLTRVAQTASQHRHLASPTDGTEPLLQRVTLDDVRAMETHAARLQISIDQVTPRSQVEVHIQAAWLRVTQSEADEHLRRQKEQEVTIRHALHSIDDLNLTDDRQTPPDKPRRAQTLKKGELSLQFRRQL